jgi:hypothetical protein
MRIREMAEKLRFSKTNEHIVLHSMHETANPYLSCPAATQAFGKSRVEKKGQIIIDL